jgi:hypothetical protein
LGFLVAIIQSPLISADARAGGQARSLISCEPRFAG